MKNRIRGGFVNNDVINVNGTIVIQGRRIANIARQIRVSSEVADKKNIPCAVIKNRPYTKAGNIVADDISC